MHLMSRIKVFALAVLTVFLFDKSIEAAEIGIHESDVIFSGEIREGDAQVLNSYIEQIAGDGMPHRFIIHSAGGNVSEAMKIGALLRKHAFYVYEPREVSCISACVFAIMGGSYRVLDGRIGLHHPLFLGIPNDNAQVQKLLLEGELAMIEYTKRMGVNSKIVRDMYLLPNEADIKYLNQSEMRAYRLIGRN